MLTKAVVLLFAAGLTGSPASAQVVINEVLENPPGSGSVDDTWEFIELYGKPGLDLTGYAVALLKGGADPDADNIPGPLPAGLDAGDHLGEIDEAFQLDGLSLGANGFLVLYNVNGGNFSNIPALLPAATARATFRQRHIPSTDVVGRLGNDTSSTYVLVRKRPNHSIDTMTGQSVYAPGYSWRKDVAHDVNFDSEIDCGIETPVNAEGPVVVTPPASAMDPYQMVDDAAWSNVGGKEYTRSPEQEITGTVGFNPDGVSRVAFYASNPHRGHRFDSMGNVVDTHMSDEEFVYGDVGSVPGLVYDRSANPGVDPIVPPKGPTDPNGPTFDGSCDPDAGPCTPAPGPYRFLDLNLTGFKLTPGTFNDVNSTGSGGINVVQFRFVHGDFNFDGSATPADFVAIRAKLGASLDDRAPRLCSDGVTIISGYVYEGRGFQSLLAMTCMAAGDGSSVAVTQADVTAERVLLGFGVAPDQNGDGHVNASDLALLLGSWSTADPIADLNGDGVVGSADLALLLGGWG